jgi:hypothetical protein
LSHATSGFAATLAHDVSGVTPSSHATTKMDASTASFDTVKS